MIRRFFEGILPYGFRLSQAKVQGVREQTVVPERNDMDGHMNVHVVGHVRILERETP